MSLSEADILHFLSLAEGDFLSALSNGPDALDDFQTRWNCIRESAERDTSIHPSTYDMLHAVGCNIAELSQIMIMQQSSLQTITDTFHARLENEVLADDAFEEDELEDECALPVPPYIRPCYEWLLDHLSNPYPTLDTKQRLLEEVRADTGTTLPADPSTPPPSPPRHRSTSSSRSSNDVSLDDIDRWFITARARIGWSDLRHCKFNGSKLLMLESARLMWGDAEHNVAPKREELAIPVTTSYDTVPFQLPSPSPTTRELSPLPSTQPHPNALPPDVEHAFACVETRARDMYAHAFAPSELADNVSCSAESSGSMAPHSAELKAALASAALAKQREARQQQRRSKAFKDAARQRAEERRHYPSPGPSGDESDSSADSDSEWSTASDDSDDEEESDDEESDSESESEVSADEDCRQPFAAYARSRTTFMSPPLLYDDSDDESDTSGALSSSELEDEKGLGDKERAPAVYVQPVAGHKHSRDDDAEEERVAKKIKSATAAQRKRPGPINTHLLSPALSTPPTSPKSNLQGSPSPTRPLTYAAAHRPYTKRKGMLVKRLTPPPGPVKMGSDGVPLGTVRACTDAPQGRQADAFNESTVNIRISVPKSSLSQRVLNAGIKVSGDPTRWANWNLDDCSLNRVKQLTGDPTKFTEWDLGAVPPSTVESSATDEFCASSRPRSASVSSQCSRRSSSSDSSCSDDSSIFSDVSAETNITEPDEPEAPKEDVACTAAEGARPLDPRFDPAVWSNYDLDVSSEGTFRSKGGRAATAFVPHELHVERGVLPLPSTAPRKATRKLTLHSPSQPAHTVAAPIVSYHEAVGTITSPTKVAFGEGQLTATLGLGHKAGSIRRKIPIKRRRSSSPSYGNGPAESSSLVDGVLSSGLADVCKEASMVPKPPKKDRRYAERAERRASQSNSSDSTDTVRARLAEIEQQAARLEAERRSLQRLASVGG